LISLACDENNREGEALLVTTTSSLLIVSLHCSRTYGSAHDVLLAANAARCRSAHAFAGRHGEVTCRHGGVKVGGAADTLAHVEAVVDGHHRDRGCCHVWKSRPMCTHTKEGKRDVHTEHTWLRRTMTRGDGGRSEGRSGGLRAAVVHCPATSQGGTSATNGIWRSAHRR